MSGHLVTAGETMALIAAVQVGSLASNRDMRLSVAGAETNVAIGVARLGGRATWISRLGNDGFGELIQRELRAERVEALVQIDTGRPTGLMIKERPNAMRTHVRYYRSGSAASAMTAFDVDSETIAAADVLHVTGITPALGPGPASAVQHAVDIARQHGTRVSVDLNYRSSLWSREDAGPVLKHLVERADAVFAGPEEAALVVPDGHHEELARSLSGLGPDQVILKLGGDGAYALVDGQPHTLAALSVPVVDTVGAGDAFVAGYLAEWMAAEPPAQRLRTAVTAGAFACTALGDWEGLPTREDLRTLGSPDSVQR
ncbi:sugar kinase [Actinobacteria bacterium YIM 96077]|uniref:Sugar kinase n=1 Tax=Phytoactinopolyspora halophila TaxID=1981511 RepID=A0A329QVL3_9ACTN|nr:sugar kinase [Phytoactinopolyspora halophila]AYY12862.1 sugar kinase [Actinobacteria bacterium YIM 96077]RAW16345.1 sugar kinase [Phytoactinopolyspora halophila]